MLSYSRTALTIYYHILLKHDVHTRDSNLDRLTYATVGGHEQYTRCALCAELSQYSLVISTLAGPSLSFWVVCGQWVTPAMKKTKEEALRCPVFLLMRHSWARVESIRPGTQIRLTYLMGPVSGMVKNGREVRRGCDVRE